MYRAGLTLYKIKDNIPDSFLCTANFWEGQLNVWVNTRGRCFCVLHFII